MMDFIFIGLTLVFYGLNLGVHLFMFKGIGGLAC